MANILSIHYWTWLWTECTRGGPEQPAHEMRLPDLDDQQFDNDHLFRWSLERKVGSTDYGGIAVMYDVYFLLGNVNSRMDGLVSNNTHLKKDQGRDLSPFRYIRRQPGTLC